MKFKYVIFVFRKDGSAAGQTNQDKHDKAEMAFKLYDKVKVIKIKQIQMYTFTDLIFFFINLNQYYVLSLSKNSFLPTYIL